MGEIGSNSRAKKTTIILKKYLFYGRRRGPRLSLSKRLALEKIFPLVKIDFRNINEKILKYKKNKKKNLSRNRFWFWRKPTSFNRSKSKFSLFRLRALLKRISFFS